MYILEWSKETSTYILCFNVIWPPWWRHQMETFSALLAIWAGNSPVPVNSPHKGQWRGTLMFSLICARMNCWANNREADDLRRHRTHYDVIVMITMFTHRSICKMAYILPTTFSNAFSWLKISKLQIKFHWNLFFRCPINNNVQLIITEHYFLLWFGERPSSAQMITKFCDAKGHRYTTTS